jgi:uncharacterized membrane protein
MNHFFVSVGWIGRLVLLSGYTNVILGFLNPYNGFEVFVSVLTAFCFLVGLYLLLFVYLELYRCFVGDKVVTENYDSRAEKKPLLKNTEIERVTLHLFFLYLFDIFNVSSDIL